ncbi:MAG: DUF4149 domain-containing protein [Desulfobulbus sp.]|nr:DUF4149 domain-containing protein [Desulfobulbus sp.]
MQQIFTVLSNLAISCWLGGAALFTFILTPQLFAACSRDMAGMIVGLLFPGYFRWGLACGAVALLCRLVVRGRFTLATVLILLAMLLFTATQAFVIEPKAEAIKQQISSFETTPKDDPYRIQFRKLHGLSMIANLAVIIGGVALILLGSLPEAPTVGDCSASQPRQGIEQRQ